MLILICQLPSRKLFTAAHELGHVILHIQEGVKINDGCTDSDIGNNAQRGIEVEANQFASSLLMPSFLMEKEVNQSDLTWLLVKKFSETYNASLEATARRVMDISKDMCALIIHQNDHMNFAKSNNFPYYISNTKFPEYLETAYYNEDELPDKLEECELSDWGLTSNSNVHKCYYSSLQFEPFSKQMTLLLVEEIDEGEQEEWENPKF